MIARLFGRRARQGAWAMSEYIAYPLFMFLATPFFLKFLGQSAYGQWMLVLVFTGFGGLSGLGMGSSSVKEVSAAMGRDDRAAAAYTTRICLAVTLISGLVFSALFFAVSYFFGKQLFQRMGAWSEVWPLFAFAAILVFLEQVDQVFAGTIRGLERFDLLARIEASSKLLMVVAALAAAWISSNLWLVLVVVSFITLVRLATKMYFASKLLSRPLYVPAWNKARALEIFHFGKWVWLQSMGSSIFSTADRLIVGSLLGATDLARYSICLQLAQQIQTVPAAGAQILFPAISNRIGAGQDFRKLAIYGSFAVAAMAVIFGLFVWLFAYSILSLWVGPTIALSSTETLKLLAVAFVVLGINVGPHFGLYGLGRAGVVAIINSISGCVAIIIAVVAIPHFGIIGAGYAKLGYGLIVCLDIVVFWKVIVRENQNYLNVKLNTGANK